MPNVRSYYGHYIVISYSYWDTLSAIQLGVIILYEQFIRIRALF